MNKSEFDEIYENYHKLVRAIVYRSLGARDLDELTQLVFIKIFEKYENLKSSEKMKAWVCTITVNVVRDQVRKNKRKSWLSFFGKDEIEIADTSERDSMRIELQEAIDLINTKLSPVLKETITLYSLNELKISEVAEILKIPIGTVKSRITEARRILNSQLEE